MPVQGETYTVRWSSTGIGREVEVTVNDKKLKVTDEPVVRVEFDGQLRGTFSVKQKKQTFQDFEWIEETEIGGAAFSAAQLLSKNYLIFTHGSPVCVDIPTRWGIIRR